MTSTILTNKNLIKITFIFGLISLAMVELVAYSNPKQGYEVSFYSSTPSLIFLLLGLTIVSGICILCHQVLSGDYQKSKVWIGGFLLLLLTRMVILYLPYIRGYTTWMGDNSTHLGLVKEVLTSGFIDSNNFYPVIHIFLTQIALITGLSVEFIVNHSTSILSIIYILSLYILSKAIFDDEKPIILTMAAVGAVIFSGYELYLMPNGWSCLFLPLAIYLIIQSMDSKKSHSFALLAVMVIVLYPFFHPLSTLMLIITLLIFMAVILYYKNFDLFQRYIPPNIPFVKPDSSLQFSNMPLYLAGICITIWMIWVLSFRSFYANIRNLVDALITSQSADVMSEMATQAGKLDLNLLDILILAIKDYGHQIIIIITFFIGVFIFIKNRDEYSKPTYLMLISLLPIAFGLFFIIYLTGMMPGLDSINAQRVQSFILLVAPILSGIFFASALFSKRSSITLLCIVLLVLPSLLALLTVIPSPYVYRPTPAITEMDLKGMGWSFQYKDVSLPYSYIMSPPDRFADILLGVTEREERTDLDRTATHIPDHFSYYQNRYLGESYTNNTYSVITKFDTVLYDTAYAKVGRFHYDDFNRLESDTTVNVLYRNDECTVYLIDAAG